MESSRICLFLQLDLQAAMSSEVAKLQLEGFGCRAGEAVSHVALMRWVWRYFTHAHSNAAGAACQPCVMLTGTTLSFTATVQYMHAE